MLGYSCRKCRKPIQATEGCTFCVEVKRLIVVTGEDQPSLQETAIETVRDLKGQLADYRKGLETTKDAEAREAIRNSIRQVANAMSKLLDSARKLQEDNARMVDKMTVKEQHQLFLGWYTELPPATRTAVYASMATAESELNNTNAGWRNILAGEPT
jgi:uncharacterized Zn finger protein (UPF0148 family)